MTSASEKLIIQFLLVYFEPCQFLLGENLTSGQDRLSLHVSLAEGPWDGAGWGQELADITIPITNTTLELMCPSMSCDHRCGEVSDIYRHQPCSCDTECEVFRDCCLDYTSMCTEYRMLNPPPNDTQRFTKCDGLSCLECVHHPNYTFSPLYMVSNCPREYRHLDVVDRCEHSTADLVFLHIPVFVDPADYLYKNVYCALCHAVNISALKVFEREILCPFNETDSKTYLEDRPLSDITFTEVTEKGCEFYIKEPETEVFTKRLCVLTDLDTCEEAGAMLKEGCDAYLEPVKIAINQSVINSDTVTARNQYCAQCSLYREREMFCWSKHMTIQEIPKPGLRFSLLFDFTSVMSVGNYRDIENKPVRVNNAPSEADFNDQLHGYAVEFYFRLPQDRDTEQLGQLTGLLRSDNVTLSTCNTSSVMDDGEARLRHKTTMYHTQAKYSALTFYLSNLLEILQEFVELQTPNVEIVFGSLRNLNYSLKHACLADPRHYNNNTFLKLLRRKEARLNVSNITNQTKVLHFPIEISWSHHAGVDLPQKCSNFLANQSHGEWSTGLNARFTVCGESLEPTCNLVTYEITDLLNFTGSQNLSTINITLLYRSGNFVTTCQEYVDSIFVRFHGDEMLKTSDIEIYVTIIGCSLSILGLMVTTVTYCTFVELRNLAGKCVLNLVAAMLLAQTCFVIGGSVAWRNDVICKGVAILQHFLWLSTFAWTNIMAFDLARTFSNTASIPRVRTGNKRYMTYFGVAWGVPLLIVIISVVVNYTTDISIGYGINSVCWIRGRYSMLVVFIVPVSIYLLFNAVSFCYTIYHIRKVGKLAAQMNVTSEKRGRLGVYARITAMMGFTWIVGYLGNIWPEEAIWIVFAAFNSLQGFFVFMSFVLTSKVMTLYRKRFHKNLSIGSNVPLTATSTSSSNLITASSTAL